MNAPTPNSIKLKFLYLLQHNLRFTTTYLHSCVTTVMKYMCYVFETRSHFYDKFE